MRRLNVLVGCTNPLLLSFDAALSNLQDEALQQLGKLLGAIADGYHEWTSPDPASAELQPLLDRFSIYRDLVEKSFVTATAYGQGRTLRLLGSDEAVELSDLPIRGSTELSLVAAARLICGPVSVYVENQLNDGKFVRALLEAVGVSPQVFSPNGKVEFRQGGGKTELIRLVFADINDESRLPFRAVVIADSDSRFPGHREGQTERLEEACRLASIPCFVLPKRSIENYFSDAHLQAYAHAYPDKATDVGSICQLSSAQRDYYPMKSGLSLDELSPGPEAALYGNSRFGPGTPRPKVPRFLEFWLKEGTFSVFDLRDRNAYDDANALKELLEAEM